MANSAMANNLRTASFAAGEMLSRGWRGAGRPWRAIASLRPATPERLLISPQDIRTADPTVAADVYAGYFAFAGKMVNVHGNSPFETPPPSAAWAAELVGFGWLRHLRAAETALASANARTLVEDFLKLGLRRPALPVWAPQVTARRLLAWLSQSPMILENADAAFYARFMKALGRHASHLEKCLGDGVQGETRLLCGIALAELGLCAAGAAVHLRRGSRHLAVDLAKQILPDGGHISRNPQTVVNLLLDLLPLRQAFVSRGIAAPKALLNSIDRMMPMLRTFRLGDGSLALFNGMGVTQTHMIATLLAYDDARATALTNAPNSGYQRLEASGVVILMETGAAPPPRYSAAAHAGQLSFEMSVDGQRFIGNCGAPDELRTAMRAAARSTAAHSTLVLEDTSSSRIATAQGWTGWLCGQILAGPRHVPVSRSRDTDGETIIATHDGYAREFGLLHQRRLHIASGGEKLAGSDRLVPAQGNTMPATGLEYAVRFHLHPTVRCQASEDAKSAELALADGSRWAFYADGMPIEVEAGVCFAVPEGARHGEQLVIYGNSAEVPGFRWVFEKLGGAPNRTAPPPGPLTA